METYSCRVCFKTIKTETERTHNFFCDECIPRIKKHPTEPTCYIVALEPRDNGME